MITLSSSPGELSLLVPLDGSAMAESALSAVALLATHFSARVLLLHIIEKKAPTKVHGERHLQQLAEAQIYLSGVAEPLRQNGITVEIHVHAEAQDDVAQSIVQHAAELNPSLVVLCSHGWGGFRDFFFGSIPEQVLKNGDWPVLLVPPKERDQANWEKLETILLPIDASHKHKDALSQALRLAQAFEAKLHLLYVIPRSGDLVGERALFRRFLPRATDAVLDLEEQDALDYMKKITEHLPVEDIGISSTVLRGAVVESVLQEALRLNPQLIVLATHGNFGIEAILENSVVPHIVDRAGRPLLLIRTS